MNDNDITYSEAIRRATELADKAYERPGEVANHRVVLPLAQTYATLALALALRHGTP